MGESNNLNEFEKEILEYLSKQKESVSIKKLTEEANLSYPTASKYVMSLNLKGKIEVRDLGSIKLIKIKEEKK